MKSTAAPTSPCTGHRATLSGGPPSLCGSTTQVLHAHVYEPLTIPTLPGNPRWSGDHAADVGILAPATAMQMLPCSPGIWPGCWLTTTHGIGPPTATMPSLAGTSHALGARAQACPAPGAHRSSLGVASESDCRQERTSRAGPRKRKRNWVGLALQHLALPVIFGILLLRTVFPLDRLFVRSQTHRVGYPGATPDAPLAQAPTTPMPPLPD
jgi:hypothetical protein